MTASKTFNRLLSVLLLVCMLLSFAPAAYAEEPAAVAEPADVKETNSDPEVDLEPLEFVVEPQAEPEEETPEKPAQPAKPSASNVYDATNFIRVVCDTDSDHHPDVVLPYATLGISASTNAVWNETLGAWTANIKFLGITCSAYKSTVTASWGSITHTGVNGAQPTITLKWDAENEKYVPLEGDQIVVHYTCVNKPAAPTDTLIKKAQVRFYAGYVLNTANENPSMYQNLIPGTYEVGEVTGNRTDGYTVDVTVHFTSGDAYEAKAGSTFNGLGFEGNWVYDFGRCPDSYTFTLDYNTSRLNANFSATPSTSNDKYWLCNGSTNISYQVSKNTKMYLATEYAVTYTDGVADAEVFADQTTMVAPGGATPAFEGTPSREGYVFTGWSPAVAETVTGTTVYTAQWLQIPVAPGSGSGNVTNELFTIQCSTVHDHQWVVNWFGSHVKLVAGSMVYDAERGCFVASATFSNFSLINLSTTKKNHFGGFTHYYEKGQSITINMYYDPNATGLNSQGKVVTGLWLPDGEYVAEVYCYDKPAAPSTTTVQKLDKIIWVHENGSFPDSPKATSKYVTSRKLIAGTYTLGEMYEQDGAFYCELTITDLAPYVKAFTDKYGASYHIDTINSYAEYKYLLKYTGSTTDYKQDGTGWTVDASSYASNSEKLNGKSLWMTGKYTVTYTDGVEDEELFADQVYVVATGDATPAFEGDAPSREGYVFLGWSPAVEETVNDYMVYTAQWLQIPAAPGSSSTHVSNELFTIQCTTVHDHQWVVNWFGSHVKLVPGSMVFDEERGCFVASATFSNFSLINLSTTKKNYFGGFTHYYEKGQSITIDLYWDPDATGLNSQRQEVTGLWLPDGEYVAEVYCYDKPAAPSTTTVQKLDKIIWVHENGSYPGGPKATSKYVTSRKLIAGTYTLGEMYEKDGSFYCELTITDLAPYVKAFTDKYGEGYYIDTINSLSEYKYLLKYTGSTTDYKQDGTGWTVDASSYASNKDKLNGKSLWLTNKYTVTYTDGVEGEELFADQSYTVAYGSDTPAFAGTPERTGYTFTGWEPKVDDTVTDHATYTATWSANTYNVSFDSNGGDTVEPITVTFDGKYGTLPSAGYIDGFQNGGWYLVDEDGTVTETQINKRTVVTTARDHTLFQNRSIKTPNVKIALTTPSEDIADGYIYYWPADSRRVLTVSFVKEYNDEQLVYTYQWYKNGELLEGENDAVLDLEGNVADSGEYKCVVTAAKKDDCTVVTTNEKASAELTQTVKILKASNTIEYDANGGEGGPVNNFSNANYATVQSGQPTREGYTFTGWNTEADGSGDSYKGGDKYVFEGDVGNGAQKVVLYAQWSANEYTLTVAPNNGEEPYVLTITYDDVVGDMVKEPVWEGHDFTGWVDQDGSPVDLTATFTTALQSINGTWTLHEYIVPVDPCNGEDATDVTYTYEDVIGDKYDFETEPERKGYTFEGWVDQDGNPVDLEATYTEDLTAINGSWKGKTYTVTFKLKEGEGTLSFTSKKVVNGDPLGYTPRVEREDSEDYTFIGWYDENGKYYSSETIFDAARDVTLTGRWIKTIVITGDESAPVLFALMMLGSLACAGAIILRLRKRKDEV